MAKKMKRKTSENKLSRIEDKLDKLIKLEKRSLEEEEDTQRLERQELRDLDDLEEDIDELEAKIKKELGVKALGKITLKDISKGIVGAFIGIVSHFAFFEGAHIAEGISNFRALLILITSFLVGLIFIYFTGYRKVRKIKLLTFVPLRVTVIYFTAILVIVFVLYIYGIIEHSTTNLLFRQVGVISLPAMLGASAADLIGGH